MKDDYLTLNIPENLAKMWFRGVGAEIVVRCQDCKHCHKAEDYSISRICDLFNVNVKEEDFCSRGEKKNELRH